MFCSVKYLEKAFVMEKSKNRDINTDKAITRKLHANIPGECRCKNSQLNISKLNLLTLK